MKHDAGWRLLALMLVAALTASACSGSDAPDVADADVAVATAQPDVTSTEPEQASPLAVVDSDEAQALLQALDNEALSIGELEQSNGPGSLVVAVSDVFFESSELGEDWLPLPDSNPSTPACDPLEPTSAERAYIDTVSEHQTIVIVTIAIFPDSSVAEQFKDALTGPIYEACAIDSFELAQAGLREEASIELSTDNPLGELVEPFVPDGTTRLLSSRFQGLGVDLDLLLSETSYIQDQYAVGIVVQGFDFDGHEELTKQVVDLLGPLPGAIERDERLDEAANRLRAGVRPEPPNDFYSLVEGAILIGTPDDDPCSGTATSAMALEGPIWATSGFVSALTQLGSVETDAAAAQAQLDSLLLADAACLVDEMFGAEIATVTDDVTTTTSVDGYDIQQRDLTVQITAPGANVTTEAAMMLATAVVDDVVTGWGYVGLRGDEPDLTALTVQAAAQIEAAAP